ncbi:hypothetical protein A2W57_00755 [Candidatus Giovannonibacteria bacterium RIFCSPHIGHO2_02_43_16]|uniref:Uncharacterized protein n=1 Tax=Candidatus Giovannonibacteria bacterium RIFCSPHIGHO2_02_43_16 TaxID=1798331 RepID=A0A1F5WG42_9BACT|nr:MAG: hypothetical protein A2W57_00755 [Candidatus Giovannonibacteria bacterium RIFCSPHIGHO2_02_43_16]
MAVFIPNENIEKNQSFGQAVNKAVKEYIEPELKRLSLKGFSAAGIEILPDRKHKVYLDNNVQVMLEFKNRKVSPSDTGKAINVDLHEIEDVKWHDQKLSKNSAKILVIQFNKDWWIWDADFKKIGGLEEKFRITTTHKIRGGGYLPLEMRKQEKKEFLHGWRTGLEKELSAMWTRHITVSQRYRGVMVYDGNYFDLFTHAQELYVLGYYYSSIIVCRTAAEQALIRILLKVGKGFEIYYPKKKGRKPMIKGIIDLVKTCRDSKLFHGKYPINKTAEKKLNEIAVIANNLVHPKHDLDALDVYKDNTLKCMDNLQYVIKSHLNFIKDTGTVSGYKFSGSAKRLK